MPRQTGFWALTCTAAGLLFWEADRRDVPFCGVIRWLFRTHTVRGRINLAGFLTGSGLVLYRHLVKQGTLN